MVSKRKLSSYLAETTVNTLRHVNIVTSCTSASVSAFFSLDGDGLCWADCFAKLASDATFFTARVTTKCMFATETRAQRSLLEWVIDGGWFFEDVSESHSCSTEQFRPENGLS
jgi:hypothetical protein